MTLFLLSTRMQTMFSTLKQTTSIKLKRLGARQKDLEQFRQRVNDKTVARSGDAKMVRSLLDQMCEWGYKFPDMKEVDVLRAFLDQAVWDTSITPESINEWGKKLSHYLQVQESRFYISRIFGQLVLDWIQITSNKTSSALSNETEEFESFRKDFHDQKEIWTNYAFSAQSVDEQRITQYLTTLFEPVTNKNPLSKEPLDCIRENFRSFDTETLIDVSADTLKIAIDCILKDDLFSGQKRKTLETFRQNTIVLKEFADVIRSELETISDWSWEVQPIRMIVRRHINGKYRVYMDEEIIDAILIQLVGMSWAKEVRKSFDLILNSDAWKSSADKRLHRKDIRRREHFLGVSFEKAKQTYNIQHNRSTMYKCWYFLAQLPDSGSIASYDEGNDDSNDEDGDTSLHNMVEEKRMGSTKHKTLRVVTTELLIQRHLRGESTYLQTDFKWFGPSISHDMLWTVLRFFHFPPKWMRFFKSFLEPEVIFSAEGSNVKPKMRVRGTPMGHALSTTLGEIILFVLDFAVNQATGGNNLYRFHDDIHFVGSQSDCIIVWKTLREFSMIMGLELNEEKSAAITCSKEDTIVSQSNELPKGALRWGFLKLLPTGQWVVDDEVFDKNVKEMTFQLKTCDTVFAFIHAYNTYVKFFENNLGHIGWALGKQHALMVMEYLSKLQVSVFVDLSDGKYQDIVPYLRNWIQNTMQEQGSLVELPDEFFYFPTNMGGLQVYNPFSKFLGRVSKLWENVDDHIGHCVELERKDYDKALQNYEAGLVENTFEHDENESFMSYEEYAQAFEDRSDHLYGLYMQMVNALKVPSPELSFYADSLLESYCCMHGGRAPPQLEDWALERFGADAFRRFGDLNVGDKEYLPIGLVSLLLKERMHWHN